MGNKESILEKIDNLNEDIWKNELKKEELERELWVLRGRNDYKDYIGKYVKHTRSLDDFVTYMKVKDFHCYERDSICRNFIDFVGNGFCIKNGAVDIHEEVHIRINSDGYDEKHNVKYNVGKCLDVITEEEYNSVLKDAVIDIIDKCGENPTKTPVNYDDYVGKYVRIKTREAFYYAKVSSIIPYNDAVTNMKKISVYGHCVKDSGNGDIKNDIIKFNVFENLVWK